MKQHDFANRAVDIIASDPNVIGLAVSGSWLSNEIDEFSDLDLVLVTQDRVAGDRNLMHHYAGRLGKLLSAFTGEHVGEPRVLICLFDEPLLHVDIKFLVPNEFSSRVEEPQILYDPKGVLAGLLNHEPAVWPFPGYQWIEDRFWIWLHYAATKIGRGEIFEALEFLSFLRLNVLAPLLLIKNNKLPKGVRKVERHLVATDLDSLKSTLAVYEVAAIINALSNAVLLYRQLRNDLYPESVVLQTATEIRSIEYFREIRGRFSPPYFFTDNI